MPCLGGNMTSKKFGEIVVGDKFSRLSVLGFNDRKYYLDCRCDCGTLKTVYWCSIKKGAAVSCGCYNREKAKTQFRTHGLRGHRLYRIWANAKDRCLCETSKNYFRYGGAGVKVHAGWVDDFKAFYDWAMSNGYEANLTLDRIDTHGDYEPANCRFTDRTVQARNRKGHAGKQLAKGVSKVRERFRATITNNKKRIALGTFATEQEASAAYKKAAIKLFGFYVA